MSKVEDKAMQITYALGSILASATSDLTLSATLS